MQLDANDEFGWFVFYAVPIAVAIGGLAYFSTRPLPPAPPPNAAVFGCYIAPDSPSISLDNAGMHVRQRGFPVIPFHLERSKTGILLAADRPIRAAYIDGGYRFGMHKRGVGRYLPLYRVLNGRTYGVFEVRLLEGFQMLTDDGAYINYVPTDAAKCLNGNGS